MSWYDSDNLHSALFNLGIINREWNSNEYYEWIYAIEDYYLLITKGCK